MNQHDTPKIGDCDYDLTFSAEIGILIGGNQQIQPETVLNTLY